MMKVLNKAVIFQMNFKTTFKIIFLEFNHCRIVFSIVDYTEGAVSGIFMTYISI